MYCIVPCLDVWEASSVRERESLLWSIVTCPDADIASLWLGHTLNKQASAAAQGASGLTLAARLNQQALLPDMMFPLVNRFNPNNGQPLPTSNGGAPLKDPLHEYTVGSKFGS